MVCFQYIVGVNVSIYSQAGERFQKIGLSGEELLKFVEVKRCISFENLHCVNKQTSGEKMC